MPLPKKRKESRRAKSLASCLCLDPDEMDKMKRSPKKIAEAHIRWYNYYIKFATQCEAIVFDDKSRQYFEECVHFLENKPPTKKVLIQSRNTILKVFDSLMYLCNYIGTDKAMVAKARQIYEISDFEMPEKEQQSEQGGTLDLLKQLKDLLNDPIEAPETTQASAKNRTTSMKDSLRAGYLSPTSDRSSSPVLDVDESDERPHKIQSMTEYSLSDPGFDSVYGRYEYEFAETVFKTRMNELLVQAQPLSQNTYSAADNLIAKMKINVPILNYSMDRIDSIDSNNVMENNEIFEGNKSVIDAVLHNGPDFLQVGPFEVYCRNKVFVYHCLVNQCNECLTTSIEFLKTHVKFNHGDSGFIDWSCTSCEMLRFHSLAQKSLDGALEHLAKYHSPKSTYSLARERLLEMNRNSANSLAVCPEEEKSEDFEIDLFHCRVPDCKFSTNNPTIAFCHYSHTADGSQIQNCEYCPFVTFSIHSFCKHVFEMHGFSKYKCGYCSYRTVSKANAISHQRDGHKGKEQNIYGFEPVENASYKYDCIGHNCLLPFVCDVCNFGTMVEQKFTRHLLGHRGMSISCHYCSAFSSDDISELCDHLISHGISQYHCLYCKEAFDVTFSIQRHLYEKHPAQYPYQIVLQDFDSHSRHLKDKYKIVQKLDIGDESVIVVPLDSDYEVKSVSIINCSKVVIVDEVDHCKAQLKYFLKNTYKELPLECEPPCEPSPNPTLLDSLDLTVDEEPVDVKPKIRLKALHLLMNQPGNGSPGALAISNTCAAPAPIADVNTGLRPAVVEKLVEERATGNPEPPLQTTEPGLTTAQIKIERLETTPPTVHNDQLSNNVQPEETAETVMLSSVQNEMSPSSNIVIKTEKNTDVSANFPEVLTAVDPLNDTIQQSASHDANHIVIQSSHTLQDVEIDYNTPTQVGNKAVSNENTLLSASSIVNMPVHFDCETVTLSGIQVIRNASGQSEQYFILNNDELLNSPSTLPEIRQETSSTLTTVAATSAPSFKTVPVCKTVVTQALPRGASASIRKNLVTSAQPKVHQAIAGSSLPSREKPAGFIRISPTLNLVTVAPTTSTGSIMVSKQNPGVQNKSQTVLYRCNICNFKSTRKPEVVAHLQQAHHTALTSRVIGKQNVALPSSSAATAATPMSTQSHSVDGSIPCNNVGCPYCPGMKFQGIQSYNRHHEEKHGDYSEVKCFIDYPAELKPVPEKVLACNLCDAFFVNESMVWAHARSAHKEQLASMEKSIPLNAIKGLKKLVCPIYNCMEEFMQVSLYKEHFFTMHPTIISCKRCTYSADNAEDFQSFHDDMDPDEAVNHFSYFRNEAQKAELLHSKRFKDPLYCLVKTELVSARQTKVTARKSTGTPAYTHIKTKLN